ncbi:MAG TPA: hypothetical protein DHW02_18260 [Ktedonobacter sp.]|nr:hypothetical protein [Ktedonobacter sp.]
MLTYIIMSEQQPITLPQSLQQALIQRGITSFDEVSLRETLEHHASTYTLIKLAEWPARRWKCRYRLMMGDSMYDAQSVAEAYALALLDTLSKA